TWSQAKTLWWRNPWLLKLKRAVLLPREGSMYGKLRREPRKECLSTIESIASALDAVGEEKEIGSELRSTFRKLLQKYRDLVR
ncbi:MAG: DTW domain-containing protein, partial [Spirochaetia bacterium]|nr:DTW domain-containing protein [Spirochaetia bacterium]